MGLGDTGSSQVKTAETGFWKIVSLLFTLFVSTTALSLRFLDEIKHPILSYVQRYDCSTSWSHINFYEIWDVFTFVDISDVCWQMDFTLQYSIKNSYTLLENLTNAAIVKLYVTNFFTISLYLTKLYVTKSFAIASSVMYSEIRQNLSNCAYMDKHGMKPVSKI